MKTKSNEVDRLVKEIVQLTGESESQAVIESLRQRLAREHRLGDKARLTRDLLSIGERCAAYDIVDPVSHAQLLYDENGTPGHRH